MNYLSKFKNMSEEVKASVAYTVCGILTRCLSFITLPIFSRLLTTDQYGIATVYNSSVAIVIIFTSLQLPYGSLSTAMIRFKEDRAGYLSSVCAISTFLTIIFFILSFCFRDLFVKVLDLPYYLIIVMGIDTLFQTAQATWMGEQRFEYKYKSVVFVTFGTTLLSTAVSLAAVYFAVDKGVARVVSSVIVTSLVGLVLYLYILKKGRKPFNKTYWKFALSFNIPLIPYYLSQVVFNQSDRLMINSMCGRSDAAIYGVAYSLATILTFVVTAIHSSYTPWIFERIDRREVSDNRRVSIILSSGIAFMLLGIIALAPEIVGIMAGEQYASAIWVVPPVAMSVLLLYYCDLFDCLLFFYESKGFLAVGTIVAAIINLVLNYFFIPVFGFVAAAYTTLISYLILAVMDYVYMLVICNRNCLDKDIYDIKGLVLVFLVFAGLGFLAMSLYHYPFVRYSIIVIVFIIMFIFRNKIIDLFKNIKGSTDND